jgi:hypothetical protein
MEPAAADELADRFEDDEPRPPRGVCGDVPVGGSSARTTPRKRRCTSPAADPRMRSTWPGEGTATAERVWRGSCARATGSAITAPSRTERSSISLSTWTALATVEGASPSASIARQARSTWPGVRCARWTRSRSAASRRVAAVMVRRTRFPVADTLPGGGSRPISRTASHLPSPGALEDRPLAVTSPTSQRLCPRAGGSRHPKARRPGQRGHAQPVDSGPSFA